MDNPNNNNSDSDVSNIPLPPPPPPPVPVKTMDEVTVKELLYSHEERIQTMTNMLLLQSQLNSRMQEQLDYSTYQQELICRNYDQEILKLKAEMEQNRNNFIKKIRYVEDLIKNNGETATVTTLALASVDNHNDNVGHGQRQCQRQGNALTEFADSNCSDEVIEMSCDDSVELTGTEITEEEYKKRQNQQQLTDNFVMVKQPNCSRDLRPQLPMAMATSMFVNESSSSTGTGMEFHGISGSCAGTASDPGDIETSVSMSMSSSSTVEYWPYHVGHAGHGGQVGSDRGVDVSSSETEIPGSPSQLVEIQNTRDIDSDSDQDHEKCSYCKFICFRKPVRPYIRMLCGFCREPPSLSSGRQ